MQETRFLRNYKNSETVLDVTHAGPIAPANGSASAVEQFREKTSYIAREAAQRGFKPTWSSTEAEFRFSKKSEANRVEILRFLDRIAESLTENPQLQASEILSQSFEIESLQRHLWKMGARFGNQSFINSIVDGDIVEIYSLDGIQIYRSWSCFEICSYSIADLLMYEWDELYERPSSMVAKINQKIGEAISHPMRMVDYDMPEYLMVEKFDGHQNKIKFQMKNIFAVLDRRTGEPIGVCSTGRAKIWTSPVETCNLSFL